MSKIFPYQRYLQAGQRLYLNPLERPEITLRCTLLACQEDCLHLQIDTRHVRPDVPRQLLQGRVVVSGEALGVGIRGYGALCSPVSVNPHELSLRLAGELQICYRRSYPRLDLELPFLSKTYHGSLARLLRRWSALSAVGDPASPRQTRLVPTPVNLSAGGMRFPLARLVPPGTLFLLGLQLPGDGSPIWAAGESVWCHGDPAGTGSVTGLRFLAIHQTDQKRIEHFIWRQGRAEGDS